MVVTLDTRDILDAIKHVLKITKDEEICIFENLYNKYKMCIKSTDMASSIDSMKNEIGNICAVDIANAIMSTTLREWCKVKRENLSKCLVDVMNTLCAKESENDR